jgi:intracellular multiplication protein IcmT
MPHFRNTYKPARFFFLDVRVGVVIAASLLHVRPYTIAIDLIVIALAWYVERLGMGVPGAVRAFRAWLAGPYRPGLPIHKIRRKVDFQYVRLPWQAESYDGTIELKPVQIAKSEHSRMVSSRAEIVPGKESSRK